MEGLVTCISYALLGVDVGLEMIERKKFHEK